jgi:prepilin-type N-terminal cleavage/methylation domain-containing protein
MSRSLAAPRRGFTLLELIIVLAVLAALAALVVPILGWVRDQSKYATAAAGAAEALNNLEIYKAANGKYPDRFDSLVDTSGAAFGGLYDVMTAPSIPDGYKFGSIVAGSTVSYGFTNGGGPANVVAHTPYPASVTSSYDPNASTESAAATAISASQVLTIDPTTSNSLYVAKVRRIVRAAFPNQTDPANPRIPTGHTLVALGIGSRVASTGSTMMSAPVHQGAAVGKYGRFIAVFAVSPGPTGRGKIQLKMVLDSEFEVAAKNVTNYQGSGPVDDQGVYVAP